MHTAHPLTHTLSHQLTMEFFNPSVISIVDVGVMYFAISSAQPYKVCDSTGAE